MVVLALNISPLQSWTIKKASKEAFLKNSSYLAFHINGFRKLFTFIITGN